MTAGQDALRESMRLEQARIYSATVPEFTQPAQPSPVLDALEADAEAAMQRFEADAVVVEAIRRGLSPNSIADAYGINLLELRKIRKRIMYVEGAA